MSDLQSIIDKWLQPSNPVAKDDESEVVEQPIISEQPNPETIVESEKPQLDVPAETCELFIPWHQCYEFWIDASNSGFIISKDLYDSSFRVVRLNLPDTDVIEDEPFSTIEEATQYVKQALDENKKHTFKGRIMFNRGCGGEFRELGLIKASSKEEATVIFEEQAKILIEKDKDIQTIRKFSFDLKVWRSSM